LETLVLPKSTCSRISLSVLHVSRPGLDVAVPILSPPPLPVCTLAEVVLTCSFPAALLLFLAASVLFPAASLLVTAPLCFFVAASLGFTFKATLVLIRTHHSPYISSVLAHVAGTSLQVASSLLFNFKAMLFHVAARH
jgi:hypothetical protein